MRTSLSLAILLGLAQASFAQVPSGTAPKFGLASAMEKDGKVQIEVLELREVMRMKTGNGNDVFIEKRHWSQLTTGTLGKNIRAYRPDGKQASSQEVLAALAKPRGVVYFTGFDKGRPVQPDPFYLSLLKEGSVALAFNLPAPPIINGVMP